MNNGKTIAIIGASSNREKYGNMAVRAYLDQGYTVYPVNPRGKIIEGLKCYKSILDIPDSVETASVYLPPKLTLQVLDELSQKGVKTIFLNPGTEDEQILEKVKQLGLNAIQACSILSVGKSPAEYSGS
ncbi:MAG: CoA-binding protein [Candidatus Omnitrophica bacterium]|nr:CoA-binding protein [Candidatus Omnitrophota bacterium]